MVFFDADVEIEGVVQGQVNGRVPSKRVMGFVQLAPRGIPLSKEAYQALLELPARSDRRSDRLHHRHRRQTGQKMRLNRFDVNNSFGANGSDIVFAAAVRGNVHPAQGRLVEHGAAPARHRRGDARCRPQLPVPLDPHRRS